jgi:hypothetical protein
VVALALPAAPAGALARTPPTSAPVLWTGAQEIDSVPLTAVACPSAQLCVAVDHAGHVLASADPGAGRWSHPVDVDGRTSLSAIACPSTSLCVATDAAGDALASSDPAAGAPVWTADLIDQAKRQGNTDEASGPLLRAISCPSSTLCVAVDAAGNALFTTTPTAASGGWVSAHIDDNGAPACTQAHTSCQAPLTGVSCPSSSMCVAVDFAGNILESTDPLGTTAWSSRSAAIGFGSLWGVSCPTTRLCASVDGFQRNVITWSPFRPQALTRRTLPYGVFGIWCGPGSLCLAGAHTDAGTSALAGAAQAQRGAAAWSLSPVGAVSGIACPSSLLCVSVDGDGRVREGASSGAVRSLLRRQALPERVASIARLLRRGSYALRFASPIAATLQITWQLPSATGPVVLAHGSVRFASPRTRGVRVSLTGAGRSVLRGVARRLPIQTLARLSTPVGALSASRRVTLTGPPRHRQAKKR